MLPATFLGHIGLQFDLNRQPRRIFTQPGVIRSSRSHNTVADLSFDCRGTPGHVSRYHGFFDQRRIPPAAMQRLACPVSNYELKHETIAINELDYLISSLKDNQQYDCDDLESQALGISSATWSLFGVIWPTSIVMALNVHKYEMAGKRVLEIGCGIGLCSIVLHRLGIDITASDYHPLTQGFLDRNILDNGLGPIKYQTGNWETENENLGKFDFIIGSDILYQPAHSRAVSRFIDRHSNADVHVIIGDPNRENRSRFTREMVALGYSHDFEKFDQQLEDGRHCKGRILHYRRG